MYATEVIEKPLQELMDKLTALSAHSSLTVEELIRHLAGRQVLSERLVIKETGEIRLIDIDEVEWIKGSGNYVELFLFGAAKPVLYRCSLKSLCERLDCNEFVRIHRSTIIRRRLIKQMVHLDRGDYQITLKSGQQLILSRNYRDNLPEVFT